MSSGRRVAVVLGSNGPAGGRIEALRYARRDAERIAAALGRPECGFSVTLPPPETDVAGVLAVLERAAESCDENDEFMCYFSGHGVLLNGTLVLLWHNTDLERAPLGTAIPIARVMTALAFCRARNRLLMLDCCHAGAAAGLLGLKSAATVPVDDLGLTSANHLVLLASDRLERARELDSLAGSFMTASVCAALADTPDDADFDGDGQLSVQDLANWLLLAAQRQNATGETVPVPYLAGQSRGPFHLTRESAWPAWKVQLPNGDTATVLPIPAGRTRKRQPARWTDTVVAIADHPITNEQFRKHVTATDAPPPTGQHFVDGAWRGPFEPWQDTCFAADRQPVVCVDVVRAQAYCDWLAERSGRTSLTGPGGEQETAWIADVDLPTFAEWDSAYLAGSRATWRRHLPFGRSGPRLAEGGQASVHERADAPAEVFPASRANQWGVTDLLGNVWEWCYSNYARTTPDRPPSITYRPDFDDPIDRDFEVRGGGFLDDVSRIELAINAAVLAEGMHTSHSDLGFRVVAAVRLDRAAAAALGAAAAGPERERPQTRRPVLSVDRRPRVTDWDRGLRGPTGPEG